MSISSQNKKTTIIQVTLTLFLLSLLLAIIGGYIYYGMRTAQQSVEVEPSATLHPDTVAVPEINDSNSTERALRMQKLEALAKESVATTSEAQRLEILENMVKENPESGLSQQERMVILKSLAEETNKNVTSSAKTE